LRALLQRTHAGLVEVLQEITGIVIDTVGACAFEFILAIAT
jgi:hypothetical protein